MKDPDAQRRTAREAEMARMLNIAAAQMGPIAGEETRTQVARRRIAHRKEAKPGLGG